MIGRSLIAVAIVVAFSAPAFAFYCPLDVKAIDAAFGNVKLTAKQGAEAVKLRNQGEALHKAGKHKDAVIALAKSMRILLLAKPAAGPTKERERDGGDGGNGGGGGGGGNGGY